MKKVIVKNLQGIQTHEGRLEDPSRWIDDCVKSNCWGLAERWVPHKDELDALPYDEEDVLEEREVELRHAIPDQDELIDSYGNVLQPAIEAVPAVMRKEVKLRAQYTIKIVDITEEIEQDKINREALAYLAETDWTVIRQMDSGEPMPAEVKAKRAEARAKVKR